MTNVTSDFVSGTGAWSEWSFGQAIGWAAGGAIGCGLTGACLGFVNALGDWSLIFFVSSLSGMYAAIGGVIGGVIGYALAHFFHEAWAGWRKSSSFLFGIFFSILIFSLITFNAAGQHLELLAYNRLMIVAGFVAALVAAGLGGVVNLLRRAQA
jgi:hypothetical protein